MCRRYSSKVDTFCHKQRYDSTCQPFDAAAIKQFQADFTVCLDEAFRLFKSVLISPHLDQVIGALPAANQCVAALFVYSHSKPC